MHLFKRLILKILSIQKLNGKFFLFKNLISEFLYIALNFNKFNNSFYFFLFTILNYNFFIICYIKLLFYKLYVIYNL